MSMSGISVSDELSEAILNATESKTTRFLKISIRNEALVHDSSLEASGSLSEDLLKLQGDDILQDDVPAYVLTRLDEPPSEWLSIFYVPDNAKVREKTLYGSTRIALTKSLSSRGGIFTDSIFATSKADLTPEAYAKHRIHIAAPKPLSAREKEIEDVRAAEREASGGSYQGSRARQSPAGTGVALNWAPEVEEAIKELGAGEDSRLVVISIDPSTETLNLHPEYQPGSELKMPSNEHSYGFYAWLHTHTATPHREIVFIYSCPSSSTTKIKNRMLYPLGVTTTIAAARSILEDAQSTALLASKMVETSDPENELNEDFLKDKLGLGLSTGAGGGLGGSESGASTPIEDKKPFSRPKGPGRRR